MLNPLRRVLLASALVLLDTGTATAQGLNKPYLALGDSIPFGFNPAVPLTTPNLLDYYHGYPQFVSQSLGLNLANASCPGETSSSFLDVAATDRGCHEWRAAGLPLFVTYADLTQSQLSYAISFLRANPKTRVVTVTIGGDDLGLLQDTCTAEFILPADIVSCELAGLGKVLATFAKNLTAIYFGVRFGANYEGPIVAVNYFSPDYSNALATMVLSELNAITLELTAAFGGRVADVFSAFAQASVAGGGLPCAPNVGLAFPNAGIPLTCNPHPTLAGQELIAKLVLAALK